MKLKRCLSMLLAVVLVVCTIPHAAFAEAAGQKTFKYVALGDSISSGYGLTVEKGDLANDRATVLTEELIADPIMEAYPMVFGEMVKELGQKEGFATQATNLSCTAYRAQDVEQTIRETYKGEVAAMMLEQFVAEGASDLLLPYHDIYEKYIPEADLVSIMLGGNDIMLPLVVSMSATENPILTSFDTSLALMLIGLDPAEALAAGMLRLVENRDKLTYSSLVEAAKFFEEVGNNADAYIENAAAQVESVVQAVKEKNPDAALALLGMFNPFEVSFKENVETFVREYLDESSQLIAEQQEVQSEEVLCQALSDAVDESDAGLGAAADDANMTLDEFIARLKELGTSIISMFAAESVAPQMLALNEYTKATAAKYGAAYVDVWGVATGNDMDPHPDVQGHKEIAERMYATLSDQISEAMKDDTPVFTDVDETTAHEADIYWLAANGISTGWKHEDGTAEFRPYSNVVRADMAAFLYRLASKWGLVDAEWEPQGTASFTDVDESTAHYKEVLWLAENGISTGWKHEDGTAEFRPYASVTRADMAAFLHRLQLLRENPLADPESLSFTDVDETTPHYADILWLAENGISTGWKHEDGTAEFRPFAYIVRADMAAFLHRMDALA